MNEEKNNQPDHHVRAGEAPDLVAGKEMDAAVAEQVMGWNHLGGSATGNQFYSDDEDERYTVGSSHLIRCWSPSARIEAAMEVVEKMRERGWEVSMESAPNGWEVLIWNWTTPPPTGKSAELPEAICRAALQAASKGVGMTLETSTMDKNCPASNLDDLEN